MMGPLYAATLAPLSGFPRPLLMVPDRLAYLCSDSSMPVTLTAKSLTCTSVADWYGWPL